jgi:hypothetical protein
MIDLAIEEIKSVSDQIKTENPASKALQYCCVSALPKTGINKPFLGYGHLSIVAYVGGYML